MKVLFLVPLLASAMVAGQPESCLNGSTTRITSPHGTFIFYSVPWEASPKERPGLWLEDSATHVPRWVRDIQSYVCFVWSSDETAFAIEDHLASDVSRSYLYDAQSLEALDISGRILETDPEARRYLNGHAYFSVDHWENGKNARSVVISLNGHTDSPAPISCFDFRYRVSRTGLVSKLASQVSGCK